MFIYESITLTSVLHQYIRDPSWNDGLLTQDNNSTNNDLFSCL